MRQCSRPRCAGDDSSLFLLIRVLVLVASSALTAWAQVQVGPERTIDAGDFEAPRQAAPRPQDFVPAARNCIRLPSPIILLGAVMLLWAPRLRL